MSALSDRWNALLSSVGALVLDGAQTVTGRKSFAQLMLAVWNSGKTFGARFTFAGSANRDLLLPDKSGTVALTDDTAVTMFGFGVGQIQNATRYLGAPGQNAGGTETPIGINTRTTTKLRLVLAAKTAPGSNETLAVTVRRSTDNGTTYTDVASATFTLSGTTKNGDTGEISLSSSLGDLFSVKAAASSNCVADGLAGALQLY